MIELTAVVTLTREDEVRWGEREYRESVLLGLADSMAKSIMNNMTVRRIRDVGTRAIKVEARLLIRERDSAMGGSMPITLADAIEKEGAMQVSLMTSAKKPAKPGTPLVEVAMRVITMPVLDAMGELVDNVSGRRARREAAFKRIDEREG